MKSRFFKKSHHIPHSTSVDSQLSGHQQQNNSNHFGANNSIDKPGLRPIGESPSSSNESRHLAILQSSLCQVSPISSHCSSTQGMIGCANELFETNRRWDVPSEMKLLANRKESSGRHFEGGGPSHLVNNTEVANCAALAKCHENNSSLVPSTMSGSGNHVADLVFTLAQQLIGKDAEINRLHALLKKSECRMERVSHQFEMDLDRKRDELDAAREQLSRLRKKLRGYETEMEIVQRVNQKMMARDDPTAEEERNRLLTENAKLKGKLAQEVQLRVDRGSEWENERKELKQSVKSLNGTMEELESELRQRECREREMQLELERVMVEREISRMRLAREEGESSSAVPMLDFPSPKTNSSVDGPCPSSTSSSGFGSLLKELPDQKELDRALAMAKKRLVECRVKIDHLVRTAEKTQRGERLNREDLFGTSLTNADLLKSDQQPNSTSASVEEHVKLIGNIRKDLELLHDKFTILYARGAIGH